MEKLGGEGTASWSQDSERRTDANDATGLAAWGIRQTRWWQCAWWSEIQSETATSMGSPRDASGVASGRERTRHGDWVTVYNRTRKALMVNARMSKTGADGRKARRRRLGRCLAVSLVSSVGARAGRTKADVEQARRNRKYAKVGAADTKSGVVGGWKRGWLWLWVLLLLWWWW